jgi:hypothetical protein
VFDSGSFIVYNLLLVASIWLLGFKSRALITKESHQVKGLVTKDYVFLFLLTCVVALRFDVGKDWQGYVDIYNFYVKNDYNVNYGAMEIGFRYLNWIFGTLDLGYEILFGMIAFISWMLILRSTESHLRYLFIVFLFLDGHFFWSMSGIRQFLVMSVWLFSIKYIRDKQLFLFSLCLLFGALFHLSALMLFPLYFIRNSLIGNIRIWYILYVVTLVAGITEIGPDIVRIGLFSVLDKLPFYSKSVNVILGQELDLNTVKIGLGFIWQALANIYILIYSRRVLKEHPEYRLYFILFFIGICLFNLTYSINIIGRFNGYLLILRPLCLALIISNQIDYRPMRVQALSFVMLYWIFFLSLIYNSASQCSPYNFLV